MNRGQLPTLSLYYTCINAGQPELNIATPPQEPIIGLPYAPECIFSGSGSLQDVSANIQWLNSRGEVLAMRSATGDVRFPLNFAEISADDAGNYVCRAVITSPDLPDGTQTFQTNFNLRPLGKVLATSKKKDDR